MTVYVAVEMFQGVVAGVKVFLTLDSPEDVEKEWLREKTTPTAKAQRRTAPSSSCRSAR